MGGSETIIKHDVMAGFFNINELLHRPEIKSEETKSFTPDEKSKALRVKFDAIHEQRVESIKLLAGRLPEENEIFFIETTRSFNAFTFIVYLIKTAGRIENLFIATYSINQRILSSLSNRISKDEIGAVKLYIAESIKYRMPKVNDQLILMQQEMKNFRVEYAWTHKKVITAKIDENYFVVEGSGNFSENSREEQYVFLKSKNIYEFKTGKF